MEQVINIIITGNRYHNDDLMFYGINSFNFSKALTRKIHLDTTTDYANIGTNYATNVGMFSILYR